MSAGETSARGLSLTLGALLLLAGLSLSLRYADLGSLGVTVALGIAALKAALVAVFFMEILAEKASVRLVMAAGLTLFALMIALIVTDIVTRSPAPRANPDGTSGRDRG